MNVAAWARRAADRIETKCRAHGSPTPWWIPVTADVLLIAATLNGLYQRHAWDDPRALLFVVPLVLCGALYVTDWWPAPGLLALSTVIPVALLLHEPVLEYAPLDGFAGTLAVVIAIVSVTDGWRLAVPMSALTVGLLVWLTSDGLQLTISLHDVVIGIVVGAMLRWLSRALEAEQSDREGRAQRAVLAERERIATEVHDLVAHSLSVTMLHLTGARNTLADGDTDEAIAALADAERVGRTAMGEIRQTVAGLRTGESENAPLPTAADLADLVEQYRRAGLPVTYVETGDAGRLSATVGLGVYRIAQEALANVTKHASGSPAAVEFTVGDRDVRLQVANDGAGAASDGGSGLQGMATRAKQLGGSLTVGPRGGRWVVDVRVPISGARSDK